MKKRFRRGQKCVYPGYGVVKVEGIEEKEMYNTKREFYILKVIENDVTVMVPTENTESVGLRSLVNKKEIKKIYDILSNNHSEDHLTSDNVSWNRRYREYAESIKSGNIFEVAEVLRNVYKLKNEKELSFGEKKIFENALNLLVKEISVSTNRKEEIVQEEIENLLSLQ